MQPQQVNDDLTITPSSISTAMTEGDLVLPTKLAGLGWWPIIFSKAGLAAASQKLQRVRQNSPYKMASTESLFG